MALVDMLGPMMRGNRAMIGGQVVTIGDTPPPATVAGRLWWDTSIFRLFISYQGMWFQIIT